MSENDYLDPSTFEVPHYSLQSNPINILDELALSNNVRYKRLIFRAYVKSV